MSAQRYERVNAHDDNDGLSHLNTTSAHPYSEISIPNSPPPSFRSRASSIASRRHSAHDRQPLVSDADRTLAETFESPSDDESDDGRSNARLDDRQRMMSGRPAEDNIDNTTTHDGRPQIERRVTQLPVFAPATSATVRRQIAAGGHDGVFANMAAKPGPGGDDIDEKPPTYEQAAADAAPPYWETTILSHSHHNPDDVFIDGLPVGSFFSFLWNGMISMSFQLVGFLLTYLLHTTHAAKNGSKAGLGVTLIQFGFSIKSSAFVPPSDPGSSALPNGSGSDFVAPPSDPNSHVFDPNVPIPPADGGMGGLPGGDLADGGMATGDWFAYTLMIVGWFILIKAVSDYVKARRHEQLVLQSPSRGLNVAVVAEGEGPDTSV